MYVYFQNHGVIIPGKDEVAKVTKKVVKREGGKKKTVMTVAVPKPSQRRPGPSASQPEPSIDKTEVPMSSSQPEKLTEVSYDFVELSQGSQVSSQSSSASSSPEKDRCVNATFI